MVRFRTLGAVDLVDTNGRAVRAVLKQPKRLGLLCFLCLGNGPFSHRAKVLGTFWPDLPPERARNNLRQSLHYLRRALPGVVRSRGRDEVGVDPSLLDCDAHRFSAAHADGAHRTALDLYGGPFLDGFELTGTRPFALWLERKRADFSTRAATAAWSLAEQHADEGNPALAVHFARRATEIDDSSEGTARKAMRFLAELGDHVGALEVYASLARRLLSLFGDRPSERTERIADDIRRLARPAEPTPDDVAAVRIMMEQWARAIREGRPDDAAAQVTDNAIMMPPMEPIVRGREGVVDFLKSRPPLVDMQYEVIEIVGTAHQLTVRYRVTITAEVAPGQPVTMRARGQTIAERQEDGGWLASAVIWNLEEAGPIV